MANTSGGKIVWELEGDSSKLTASLTKANASAKQTAATLDKVGQSGQQAANKLGQSFSSNLSNIQGKLTGVTGAMESFALKALGIGTALGGAALVGLKSFASIEKVEANLFAISGSADFATASLKKLQQISLDTAGFSVGGLASVTLDLKNIYGTADEAIRQTEILAKVISATGGSEQDLGKVVSALQMITVSGKAGSRQIRQLFQASPLFSEIAAKAGITADALENSADPLKMLTQAFEEASKSERIIESLAKQNSTLSDAWDDATESFTNSMAEWVRTSGIVDVVKKSLADFQVWLQANGPQIADNIRKGFEWVMDNKGAIINAVKAFAAVWATLKLTSVAISIGKTISVLITFIKWASGLSIVANIIKVLTTNIGVLSMIGRGLMAVLTALTSVVGLIIAAIVIWGYNIYQIVTHWRDFWDLLLAFWGWLQGFVQTLVDAGVAIITGLVNGIKSGIQAVWNGIKEAGDKIGAFFAGAGTWLYDTGKNIVQGLVNGIKDMAGAVTDTVGNIGGGIKNKFKSVLGIQSPSKVFSQYGSYIGQGLTAGLAGSIADVTGTVGVMATSLQQPMMDTNPMPTPAIAGNTTNSGTTNNIGTINIAKEVDGEKWLQKLNRNTELAGNGMVGVTNV